MGKAWLVVLALSAMGCGRASERGGWGDPAAPARDGGSVRLGRPDAAFQPTWPALHAEVEQFSLSFSEADALIVYDPLQGSVYVPGVFGARGIAHAVELRQRGQGSRDHPKHSWKVRFPEGTLFDDARRLNFLAEYWDAGYLTDLFSYRMMQAAGALASDVRYVTLQVNGEFQGVYTQVESVDKWFLRHHGLDHDATVYRCGERDCEFKITPPAHYQDPWEKKTNESEPNDDLDDFLWGLSRTPEHEFEAWLERNLDVENYLRYLAAMAMVSTAGIDDSGSYFIHDRDRDRWTFVPWDLNNTAMLYGRTDPVDIQPIVHRPLCIYTAYDEVNSYEWKQNKYGGAHRAFSVLNQRIWDRPPLRNRLLDWMERLAATVFSEQEAWPQIDAMHALIREELRRDPWVNLPNALHAPEYLKQYVTGRLAFLATEIPRERHRGDGGLVINAIGAAGGSRLDESGTAESWIEIFNREDQPRDLGGLVVTDSLREEFKHVLPAGLVVPAKGKLVLWADGQVDQGAAHLPFLLEAEGGELGLFDGLTRWGLIDALYYAPMAAGREYGRVPDGAESWGWTR